MNYTTSYEGVREVVKKPLPEYTKNKIIYHPKNSLRKTNNI